MEWTELIKEVAGVGGNLGVSYIICYTVVEIIKTITLGIVGYKGVVALSAFMKDMFDF